LIVFALTFRAFYSVIKGNADYFLLGLYGFAIFFVLAQVFYYSKAFAGGDAKLLMGYGVILPYSNYPDLFFVGIGFVFLLFFCGAIYTLIYSIFLTYKNKVFYEEFKKYFRKARVVIVIAIITAGVIDILLNIYSVETKGLLFSIVFALSFLFIYLRSLDKSMIKLKKADELAEGDWLERDVKVNGRVISKSVHGLSNEEIRLLKKYNKNVLIKQGVPFTPAFLIALIVMVFFFLV